MKQQSVISRAHALMGLKRLLLLLVQRVATAPAQVRATFLHSPEGETLVRVLYEISGINASGYLEVWVMPEPPAAASGQRGCDHQQQQQKPAGFGMQACRLSGRAVVELLVLPGLLLQPVAPSRDNSTGSVCSANRSNMQGRSHATLSSSSGGSSSNHVPDGPPPSAPQQRVPTTRRGVVVASQAGEC
jgi:hypothetical protein